MVMYLLSICFFNVSLNCRLKRGYFLLGGKEDFDKEQIGVKEPFPVTKCQFTS